MSIYRRKDGRWQASYRDYENKHRTKTFSKGRAGKKKAEQFLAEIQYNKAYDAPLPQSLREGLYLDDLLQDWVDTKKAQGCSLQWITNWVNIFNKYIAPTLCTKPAHAITQTDILAVINAHWGDKSQTTRNRYLEYIKTLYEFGIQQGHLQTNPLHGWKKGKEQRRVSRLTLDDMWKIQDFALSAKTKDKDGNLRLKGSPAPHLAWAIEVAWNVPVRPGRDLYGLTFRNVNFDRGGVNVYHSKVNKHAFVKCHEDFMRELWVKKRVHHKHLIEFRGKPVKSLKRSLKHAAEQVGLEYEVTMYDIRHLWITTMLDQGLEISAIAYMAGTSMEMIQRHYYEPHQAETGRAIDLLPRREKKASGKIISMGDT
ncbi:MAG: tyrosine-type recombinase/integrase [Desulfovermiculus sp.]